MRSGSESSELSNCGRVTIIGSNAEYYTELSYKSEFTQQPILVHETWEGWKRSGSMNCWAAG